MQLKSIVFSVIYKHYEMDSLNDAAALSDPKQKREKYNQILESIINQARISEIEFYLEHSTFLQILQILIPLPFSFVRCSSLSRYS